jgi:hypothetical protein
MAIFYFFLVAMVRNKMLQVKRQKWRQPQSKKKAFKTYIHSFLVRINSSKTSWVNQSKQNKIMLVYFWTK